MLQHRVSNRAFCLVAIVALLLGGCGGSKSVKPDLEAEAEAKRLADQAQMRMENEFTVGKAAYLTGDYKKAEALFFAMSRAYPDFPGPHANLAMVYAKLGKVDEAEQSFRIALTLNPNQPELYNHLGIMYREKGEFAKALLKYKEGLELAPDYPNLLVNIGILYELYLRQPQDALKYYQRYQELKPDDKVVAVWIADVMQRAMAE